MSIWTSAPTPYLYQADPRTEAMAPIAFSYRNSLHTKPMELQVEI